MSFLTGFILVAAVVAGDPPAGGFSSPAQGVIPAAAFSTGNPMDEPLRLIAAARQTYEQVHDYTCLFVKRERIRGQLQPENLIEMKVLTQPFSVYLRWLAPQPTSGQEACYV